MEILIGILLVIVFVLLVQRTVSPFRCQEGEEEKNGGCVSNSTKDRWWAFWESPKCKRGELQSDYTCLASMIWDAVSPGTASSPPAATPPAATSSPNSEVLVAQMIQNIKQKFLNMSTDAPTEYRVNVGVADACPFDPNSTVMLNYSIKSAVSDADMADFRRALSDFFRTLHPNDPGLNTIDTIISQMDIYSYVNTSINHQTKIINLTRCSNDFTANPSNPDFLPMVIFSNLITAIIGNAKEAEEKIKTAQAGGKTEGGLVQDGVQMSVENRKVEGNAVMSSQQSQVVTQTSVEVNCRPSGSKSSNKYNCCSNRLKNNPPFENLPPDPSLLNGTVCA